VLKRMVEYTDLCALNGKHTCICSCLCLQLNVGGAGSVEVCNRKRNIALSCATCGQTACMLQMVEACSGSIINQHYFMTTI